MQQISLILSCTDPRFAAGRLEPIPKPTPTQIKTHRASVSALPS
eukprot:SAG25_NODE_10749_length_324_cov_0.577778_1_plen_43_part_01